MRKKKKEKKKEKKLKNTKARLFKTKHLTIIVETNLHHLHNIKAFMAFLKDIISLHKEEIMI